MDAVVHTGDAGDREGDQDTLEIDVEVTFDCVESPRGVRCVIVEGFDSFCRTMRSIFDGW